MVRIAGGLLYRHLCIPFNWFQLRIFVLSDGLSLQLIICYRSTCWPIHMSSKPANCLPVVLRWIGGTTQCVAMQPQGIAYVYNVPVAGHLWTSMQPNECIHRPSTLHSMCHKRAGILARTVTMIARQQTVARQLFGTHPVACISRPLYLTCHCRSMPGGNGAKELSLLAWRPAHRSPAARSTDVPYCWKMACTCVEAANIIPLSDAQQAQLPVDHCTS